MNEPSGGLPPDFEDRAGGPAPSTLQRAFMDRARRAVEREQEQGPSRLGRNVIAMLAAVGLALTMFLAFDAFLGGMQRVMHRLEQQEQEQLQKQQQEEAERRKKEPMPAYVVPGD
jgi:flagellar biosynthesis/type III secretory pathway M-ring protein FliF/YscJ